MPSMPINEAPAPRPGIEHGTPNPAGPKPAGYLKPSNNPDPIPDRAKINHVWKKELRPKKSALHNPLTPIELAKNMKELEEAPPHNYERCMELDEEEEVDEKVPSGLASGSGPGSGPGVKME